MVDLVEDDNVDLRALSLRQSHPGAPVQALYEALKNLDEACAIAIALKPLCGPNRASNIAEGRMVGARGVDLNAKGGVTPLMLAVSFGSISVARRLLEAGASVDKADVEYMSTPLHLSVTVEMTSLLLSYNANPNAPDKVGYTPLHNAAAYGGSAMIPLLIEHGGDVTIKSIITGFTPMHTAAMWGRVNVLYRLIWAGAEPSTLDHEGRTPLYLAVVSGRVAAARLLASQKGAPMDALCTRGEAALHHACSNAYEPCVELLLENGANVNVNDIADLMPIHYSVGGSQSSILDLLLSYGSHVTCLAWSPLHAAVTSAGDTASIVKLLNNGCDVHACASHGRSPLHLAVEIGCIEKISLLVAEGANINAMDESGNTPLHHAVIWRRTSQVFAHLLSLGSNKEARNQQFQTPLHLAAGKLLFPIIETLISLGCDVNARDAAGRCPIHLFDGAMEPSWYERLTARRRPPSSTATRVRGLLAAVPMETVPTKQCLIS